MSQGTVRSQPLPATKAEYATARQDLGQWEDPVTETATIAELVINLVELRRVIRGATITGSSALHFGPFTVDLKKVKE